LGNFRNKVRQRKRATPLIIHGGGINASITSRR
jgi:hypothetical protein